MLEFVAAFLSSLGTVPGLLLALALAPRLTGRLVIVLAVIDLWLLLEVIEALARPAYLFGTAALPRLMASALQVAIALAAFGAWQRLGTAEDTHLAAARPPKTVWRRRPIGGSRAPSLSGAKAA